MVAAGGGGDDGGIRVGALRRLVSSLWAKSSKERLEIVDDVKRLEILDDVGMGVSRLNIRRSVGEMRKMKMNIACVFVSVGVGGVSVYFLIGAHL